MKNHIHIFGASGSGTTTIAQALCQKINYTHYDSDNYFWLPTESPFSIERDRTECIQLMQKNLQSTNPWILSGSITGWGDALIPLFDLVVFVYVPQEIRMERLMKREFERYGNQILPGGNRHQESTAFIEWAKNYDTGTKSGRNLSKHIAWMQNLTCPVIRIENDELLTSIDKVLNSIEYTATPSKRKNR